MTPPPVWKPRPTQTPAAAQEAGPSPTGPGPSEPEQAAVVAWLGDATRQPAPPQTIETQISHVFLIGDRAYKLKRALQTPFLNQSTRARRRAACLQELAINRAWAPTLYLGVRPIIADGANAFRFGARLADDAAFGDEGDDHAVDYVVEMARFDPGSEFDRLADAGRITPRHLRALADGVAARQEAATVVPSFGGGAKMRQIARGIAASIGANAAEPSLIAHAAAWSDAVDAALADLIDVLDARRRHGAVRRLHGDLHLGNICLVDGQPTPFDAIEFSDDIATVDRLYDMAFPVMDLLARERRAEANVLLSRYLALTRDYSGLRLLPAFVSLRAAVRAIGAAGLDPATARRRLAFAQAALTPPDHPPRLIAIGGPSGSGKSTLAQALAPRLGETSGAGAAEPGGLEGLVGGVTLRSDVTRKRLFGHAPEEPLGPDAYAPDISDQVYRRLFRDAGRALRAGASVLLDAAFLEPERRRAAAMCAARAGADFQGLWLTAPQAALEGRIRARRADLATPDASDADPTLVARQLAAIAPPNVSEPAWVTLTADRPLEALVDQALRLCAAAAERAANRAP